jgi:hypothetical protein
MAPMSRPILTCENDRPDVETEPLTYLEEHHPAFTAELLAIAAEVAGEDAG